MYGYLLSALIDYIKECYGEQVVSKILNISDVEIIDDKIYPDEFMEIIMNGTKENDLYKKIGRHLVKYLLRTSHGSAFFSCWNDYTGFLSGLDKFEEYLKIYFPSVKMPLFTYIEETEEGFKLECCCKDENLKNFALGFIEEIGMLFYKKDLRMFVKEESDHEGNRNVLIEIKLKNKHTLRKCSFLDKYSFPLDPTLLGYIFPYSLLISSCMTVCNLGVSLLPTFSNVKGQHLSKVVSLKRPQIPISFNHVLSHSSNLYDILMKSTSPARIGQDKLAKNMTSSHLNQVESDVHYLRLKGRMLYMKTWNMLIFIGTPVFFTLSSLTSVGLNISYLSIHDFSRDIMLAEAQQTVELKMTFEQGREKHKKLELFLLKLNEEMKRTNEILNEMVPGKPAIGYNEGRTSLELLANVSVLISDIVKFTSVCSLLKPMEVVTLLNTMYSEFDFLTAKHGVYKVETIGDAYMVVSAINGKSFPQKVCDVALDMREAIKNVTNPKTGGHLQIRIGIHTGPVMSGVIGLKVPKFCLFGGTVKTAVLLEASSQPMKIKISQATNEALSHEYRTIESEHININGGGKLATFWLLSKDLWEQAGSIDDLGSGV